MTEKEKIIYLAAHRVKKMGEKGLNTIEEMEKYLSELNRKIDAIKQEELNEIAPLAGTHEMETEPPSDKLEKLYQLKFKVEKTLSDLKGKK